MDEELEITIRAADDVELATVSEYFSAFEVYEATRMSGDNVLKAFLQDLTKPMLESILQRLRDAYNANIIKDIEISTDRGRVKIGKVDAKRLDDVSLFAEEIIDALRRSDDQA